jgi:hypothetical protein
MTIKHETEMLKRCIANHHEKMLGNVLIFENGKVDLEKLDQYLESCNEINMGRIMETIRRMKAIQKRNNENTNP